jgi:hypothetical protein
LQRAADYVGASRGGELFQLVQMFVRGGHGTSGEVHTDQIGSLDPRAGDDFKSALYQGRRPPLCG